jgi:uncharacterized protein YbjT (DUF2867 family)
MVAEVSKILLTGATGYIGGRLLTALQESGRTVRCLARNPDFLRSRVDSEIEVVQGDCLQPSSLRGCFDGVETAYYLIHSMGSAKDFEAQDRAAATHFGQAAREAGVARIVYVGGLGSGGDVLSKHLRSRHETGVVLRESGIPVVEFRSSIVLGSGSLSFELIRTLVERLPVMICPSWVRTPTQPIAIEDLVSYLTAVLDQPIQGSEVFEIGGVDRVSYREIMLEYARQRGLRRYLIPVPLLTPRLSSLWLGLTTPVYARVGRKLVESLRNPTIVHDDSARTLFGIRTMGLRDAIARAIGNEDAEFAATRWSDAVSSSGSRPAWGGVRIGTRLVDSRSIDVDVSPQRAFEPIRRIGGQRGWYYLNWLWRIRGAIDLLLGGVGMRRGRRDPEELAVGDTLDWWRVESYKRNALLRLAAEMKLPGRAWLEYEVKARTDGGSTIRQTAVFDPAGLLGLGYWYAIYPLHSAIFSGMLSNIAQRAGTSHHDSR